jgi:hypothetical protein
MKDAYLGDGLTCRNGCASMVSRFRKHLDTEPSTLIIVASVSCAQSAAAQL